LQQAAVKPIDSRSVTTPGDLGEIWVLSPLDNGYIKATAIDTAMKGMTEYQWRVLKRAIRERFDDPDHLLSLAAGRNAVRDVAEEALRKPSRRRPVRLACFVSQSARRPFNRATLPGLSTSGARGQIALRFGPAVQVSLCPHGPRNSDIGADFADMEPEQSKTLPIVFGEAPATFEPADEQEATLGARDVLARAGRFVKRIPVERVQQSLKDLTATLTTIFADLKAVGEFELSEVQVGVELTVEGGVNLIGNVTAGAKGAMQLTFKPPARIAGS
jgi:hypothetical protein